MRKEFKKFSPEGFYCEHNTNLIKSLSLVYVCWAYRKHIQRACGAYVSVHVVLSIPFHF